MRQLSAEEIVWLAETGSERGPAAQALAILSRAKPEDRPGDLPLGRRDALLMAVRAQLAGPKLELVSTCPHCGMALELNLTTEQLGLDPDAHSPPRSQTIDIGGREIAVRPVTAAALAEAEELGDIEEIRAHLLRAVAPDATHDETVLAAVEAAVEALDPDAETVLDWRCPACETTWSETLDAAALAADEIRVRSRTILTEVATLARTYHWSERDILAMPPQRRRFYIEAAG